MLAGRQVFAGQNVLELFQEFRNVQPDRYAADVPEPYGSAAPPHAMKKEKPEGLFTRLFRRFPEGWKIVHDHTSS
jgi:hypothetical protein